MTRRVLTVLFFSFVCLALIIGGLWLWYSEQWAERRLQEYIGRLEDSGFVIEERSLADFQADSVITIHFFSDFRSYAQQEGISHMYFDKGTHALYFLHFPTEDRVEANIFYYK